MKTYKSSDLTHKRAEVLEEAKANGVIIQECKTNGDVRCELVLLNANVYKEYTEEAEKLVALVHDIHSDIIEGDL